MQKRVAIAEGLMTVRGPAAVAAAVIGNGLEWYNFMLFGVFASVIAKQFFPVADPLSSLLLSLGTFSVGFFMRPLGGTLLGMYSDGNGRKAALSLTIMLMCVGTAMIALMPSYDRIGIAAPVLLVVARLLQGFSTGGEMGNATAYMREAAPDGRSGFYVSWVYASSSLFANRPWSGGRHAGDARLQCRRTRSLGLACSIPAGPADRSGRLYPAHAYRRPAGAPADA